MRNFLNSHRIILHLIIGFFFAHFMLTLIWGRGDITVLNAGSNFSDHIDFVFGNIFWIAAGLFFAGLMGWGIEELQIRQRGGTRNFDWISLFKTAFAGIPAGILYLFTCDNANDSLFLWIDGIIVLIVGTYYFWDYAERKK